MAEPHSNIEALQDHTGGFDNSDADSGYGDEAISTQSLRSSIFDYEQENGRSYHAYKAGKYVMPNDDREQERMDIHYHALRLTFGNRHYFAPIEQPTSILDVGTGTGIWAMDVADDHPQAHVIGFDLSPIQPTHVPPNLEFQIADADEHWTFTRQFDLVHTRLMNGFSVRSWDHFYAQAFNCMKPGGWVENQEFDLDFRSDDNTQSPEGAVNRWQTLWNAAVEKNGMTGRCYPQMMCDKMRQAGFINVAALPYKMPVGPWPKDPMLRQSGLFNLIGMLEGVSGLSVRVFTQMLGWSVEELELLLMDVRKEWKTKKIHSYLPIWVVYGQKPMNYTRGAEPVTTTHDDLSDREKTP